MVSCNESSSSWAKQRSSPATDGWLDPVPTLILQSTGGPSFGHCFSNPFSSVVQSPWGPAQCGQSASPGASPAAASAAHTSHRINVVLRFMVFFRLVFLADTVNGLAAPNDDLVLDEEGRPCQAV